MLTDSEKFHARHDGGKALGNRKRHLAQIKSALLTIGVEAVAGMPHLSVLSANDITTLREAAQIVGRIEAGFAKDAKKAKDIKAAYDSAIKAASQALRGLVRDPIADPIALHVIANPRDPGELADLLTAATNNGRQWQWRIEQMQRDAVAELACQIVRAGNSPSTYCSSLDMQGAKDRHAGLIAQVKACAVAQKLQAAA